MLYLSKAELNQIFNPWTRYKIENIITLLNKRIISQHRKNLTLSKRNKEAFALLNSVNLIQHGNQNTNINTSTRWTQSRFEASIKKYLDTQMDTFTNCEKYVEQALMKWIKSNGISDGLFEQHYMQIFNKKTNYAIKYFMQNNREYKIRLVMQSVFSNWSRNTWNAFNGVVCLKQTDKCTLIIIKCAFVF